MKIDLARLSSGGEQFVGVEPPEIMDLSGDVLVQQVHPVRYDLRVELVGNELLVRGKVETEVTFACSRCAEPVVVPLQENRFLVSLEVSDEAEYVDLTPEIRESMILAFPSQPVCRDDCKGLCPYCGKNWNEGSCECQPPPEVHWDALDGLKL
jgi:uncharacterized protein